MDLACLSPELSNPTIWAGLPCKERNRVKTLNAIFEEIFSADSPLACLSRQARKLAGQRGYSEKSLQRYYYALREGADWTVFVPKQALAKASGSGRGLPPEFVEFWHGWCIENKRKIQPAYRALKRYWEHGGEVPGYGTWRDWWRQEKESAPPEIQGWCPPLPEGWSYQNLFKHRPSDAVMAVARRGRKELSKHRPLVLKTRAGMLPGQIYMFDDVWWDNRCRYGSKDVRPLELGCMDVASAYQFAWGMRPLMENDWSKKKSSIKESEMRFLLASVLTQTGFHPGGVKLIVERGTAAIREELARLLHDLSGGLIQVDSGGLEGNAFLDQFRGQSSGNSRFKALKESLHNPLHNEAGALPGQMGKDYQHAPEQLYGLQHYNKQLMLAASQLPKRYAEALIFPIVGWEEFMQAATELYARMHDRTDHNLEGWEANGNTDMQWRLGEAFPWQSRSDYMKVPLEQRAAIDALIAAPGNNRQIKLSPKQVWQRGAAKLNRLPSWTTALILGDQHQQEQLVQKNHCFVIRDRSVSQDAMVFPALLTTKEGEERLLPAGERYAVCFNPFAPNELIVSDAKGSILGTVARDKRSSYLDTEALKKASGQASKIENKLLGEYAKAARKELKAKKKMHENNAAVLAAAKAEGKADLEKTPAEQDIAASVMEDFGGSRADDEWND